MGRYRKTIEEGTFEHRFYRALGFPPVSDDGGIPLVIRITLGDMELLDGFYMPLPADASDLSIEDAIGKYVLCESEEDRIEVKRKLSRDPNPDLLDIYEGLLCLYEQGKTDTVTLSYHINDGASDIQPTDLVSLHQRLCTTAPPFEKGRLGGIPADGKLAGTYRLLDLVLEVYDNLDPFSGLTDEQKDAMLKDFRGIFVLYLMDKFGYETRSVGARHASPLRESTDPKHLSTVLEYLMSEDVGLATGIGGEYYITPRGHDLLNSIIDEAEFYIDNYDIFGDVYVRGGREIRFDTGYGDNLIVPVFMREGIDPYRALFIAALYLGNMDELAPDLDILSSEDPFRELLNLIACSPTEEDIGTELLDRVIREGSLKVRERQLREARVKHIESIKQRIRSVTSQ
jgi:hypothetical protein